MYLGFLIIVFVLWEDRKIMRLDFKAVQVFITLMILLTFLRIALASAIHDAGFNPLDVNKGINQVSFWQLGLVFWEDAFFAAPIYYMKDRLRLPRFVWLPIVAALSIYFALGHLYQSELAFFATLLIPYFVFYKFGKKYGFGTTMVCHVLFDMFTLLTFKMLSVVL